MKHRSVIAFILLAAALFAAPQISNDLSAFKSAVGARIRGEILHAFLNLRADDAANELVTRPAAQPLLASYQAKSSACPLTQAATKKSDARAQVQPRAEATAKPDAVEQFAMLVDPTSGLQVALAALSNVETRAIVGEAAPLAAGDIAMLNAPDSGVALPSLADALTSGSNEREAAKRWRKSTEKNMRVAYVTSGLEKFDAQKLTEETLRQIGTT